MSNNQRDEKILTDLLEAKETGRASGTLLDFYEALWRMQFDFKNLIVGSGHAACLQNKEINTRHLNEGMPQISFHETGMASSPFMELYGRILEILVPYVGCSDFEENHLPEMVLEDAQEIFSNRGPLVVLGPPVDISKTAGGFVLAPYLQLACECIMPRLEQSAWHQASCPICGGLPSFAALAPGGSRTLLCPRCHGEWAFKRVGCPFCNNGDSQTYYANEGGKYRLYVCDACRRYLKVVDRREGNSALSLPVESIVTTSMDIAAQEEGYRPY